MEDLSYVKPGEPVLGFRKDVFERNDRIPKSFSFSADEKLDDAIQVYLRLKPDYELSTVSLIIRSSITYISICESYKLCTFIF